LPKLGSELKPIRVRVQSESRAYKIAQICNARGWKFIAELAPNDPEDVVEFDYKLNPSKYLKEPHITHLDHKAKAKEGASVSRNDPCPCGSGKKYKKCCMLK